MADGGGKIRVASIDVMQRFRPALIKFMEEGAAAITSTDSDAGRTLEWVQREQLPYWKKELRRREELLTRAKGELIRKQAGDGKGAARPAVEEKKAVEKAKRAVEEATEKIQACSRWSRELERHIANYKGQVQGLNTMLSSDLPNAVAVLDRMAAALEAYTTNIGTGGGGGSGGGGGGGEGGA